MYTRKEINICHDRNLGFRLKIFIINFIIIPTSILINFLFFKTYQGYKSLLLTIKNFYLNLSMKYKKRTTNLLFYLTEMVKIKTGEK